MSKLQLPDCLDDVGPGWTSILTKLHADISAIVPDYGVSQVKEKFGALRIYLNYPEGTGTKADEAEELLAVAEAESESLCEQCGKPGTTGTPDGNMGWLKTLCPEHSALRAEEQKNRWK